MARLQRKPAALPHCVHRGIFGRTLSGKTAIAKFMVRDAGQAGIRAAILDPLADPDWPLVKGDFITRDREEFRRFIRTHERRLVVIDESSKAMDRYDPDDDWPFTMGRHLGHLCVCLAQQPKQVNPTIRAMLSKIYCLALPMSYAKFLADEWGRPELIGCATFRPLEVMECSGFADTRRGVVNFKTRRIEWKTGAKNVA